MFEPKPLDRVGKLDVHAEIIGIELELVAFEQRRLFVDVHRERREIALNGELPMTVLRWIGLEIDPAPAVAQFALCLGHGVHAHIILPRERRDRPRGDRAGDGWRNR